MTSMQARNAYRQTESLASVHPVKLVHLMYERVLLHLERAEAAIADHDPVRRGENLGRAIALITELNAAIRPEDDSEAAQFLRGLYTAILVELPKVAVDEDVDRLRRAYRYLERLKRIWEDTAMREHGFAVERPRPAPVVPAEGDVKGVSLSI